MYDKQLASEILSQILGACERIMQRTAPILSSDDFLDTEPGLEKLDAVCMQLIATGESLKNLDKVTRGTLLDKYPEFEWKKAMGMRDIIAHHYFDLNADIVFDVCKNEIPKLARMIRTMLENDMA